MSDTGIIVLAAGGSKRMSKPKLAIELGDGRPILERAIEIVSLFKKASPVLILGAYAEIYLPIALRLKIRVITNPHWRQGMSSSLIAGLKFLLNERGVSMNRVLIILADQPFISSDLLQKIIRRSIDNGSGIVACDYGGIKGPPVCFSSKYFNKILELEGDVGAKNLIEMHPDDILLVDFPGGKYDVNTPEDLKRVLQYKASK